jgi:hypothetical protein
VCTASCTIASASGNVCGDRVVDAAHEICDDGNASACGTCDATCRTQSSVVATGFIIAVAGNQLVDGQTFTLADGRHAPTVFELDSNNAITSPHVAVHFLATATADALAASMITAINSVTTTLDITASSSGGAVVALKADFPTSLGNIPIAKTVANTDFVAIGMSGGTAGNCTTGVGCATNNDCASHVCTSFHCQ